jgi:hypothetical protein
MTKDLKGNETPNTDRRGRGPAALEKQKNRGGKEMANK